MLGHTDNIVIIQNNIIGHKKSLSHTKQDYIITYQHNKTQYNTMLGNTHNIVIVQNNIIRHETSLSHTKQDYIITQQHN